MTWGFEVGRTYNRQKDIHAHFSGQQQGGIITPKDHNLIIIVTGEEGGQHGYADVMREDGVFEYFGEGQVGDMVLLRGNSAVFNHAENGKDLLLFRKSKSGLRFEGQFVAEGILERDAPDTEGNMRTAFVFELRPLEALIEGVQKRPAVHGADDLATLRAKAIAAAKNKPRSKKGNSTATVFERSQIIRDYVFARAKGNCESCGQPAPFTTAAGVPFLEVHHIRRLSDGGPDDPAFMIGICPNCHRQAHYGAEAKARNEEMLKFVALIEGC
jgi:5-methylcytosine-specific restriction protein A